MDSIETEEEKETTFKPSVQHPHNESFFDLIEMKES